MRTALIAVTLILATGACVAYFIMPLADQEESYPPTLHVEQADEDEIEGTIIDFEDMTDDQQRIFKSAIGWSEPIPEGVNSSVWIDNRGVSYQNETYRASVAEV